MHGLLIVVRSSATLRNGITIQAIPGAFARTFPSFKVANPFVDFHSRGPTEIARGNEEDESATFVLAGRADAIKKSSAGGLVRGLSDRILEIEIASTDRQGTS